MKTSQNSTPATEAPNTTQAKPSDDKPNAWDKQPGEPAIWYDRLLTYIAIGPQRTIEETFRQRRQIEKGLNAARPTGYWHTKAAEFNWEQRAGAYDRERQQKILAIEETRKLEARETRRTLVEDLLNKVRTSIGAAELDTMDVATARRHLPTLRALLHDLLMAHRLEMGEPTEIKEEINTSDINFTADELAEAQKQLAEEWETQMAQQLTAEEKETPIQTQPPPQTITRHLLVIIGNDQNLTIDLAILRGVSQKTGLQWHRLLSPTKEEFEAELLRSRRNGITSQYMHMAVHASPNGIKLADGIADGEWLSERLSGVKVLVIAGCKSTALGDWLSVVPFVISFREEISHQNASAFTEGFWTAIASNRTPDEALEDALKRCMPTTREYVHKHW